MNKSIQNFLDLPDELLILTFRYFNFIDIINSFFDDNEQFDRIVCNNFITKTFDFSSMFFYNNQISDRFEQILPRIRHNKKSFKFRSISQEYLLHLNDYPNLYKLNLDEINLN